MKHFLILCSVCLLFSIKATAQNSATLSTLKNEFTASKALFGNELYTRPASKTSKKKVAQVQNPLIRETLSQMLEGTYDYTYRVQKYRSYLHPEVLARKLKTSGYSQFENPTGIFFTSQEPIALLVGDNAKGIGVRVTNFGQEGGDSSYPLNPGLNVIIPSNSGNGYIQYFTDNEAEKGEAEIHIMGGTVNGYFDATRHTNSDWVKLLENAGEILDMVGERVQLAYSVESLKKYCPNDGVQLLCLYDSIISIQHGIMGLNKYNRVPDNHMFGRVIWKGFMHADGRGAAFHDSTMSNLADPTKMNIRNWGIAHEFGHVNQVRPWMKWVGTTEVTNNIFSVWTQYLFDPQNPKLEREVLKDYDGRIAGGRITSYMESAFIHKQEWLTQAGPDRWERQRPRDWGGDHFVKLVPFWQLQLYYAVAGEGNSWYHPDFYADIYIKAIDREGKPSKNGEAQLAFIKQACDVTQTDLTGFFEYSGMLLPIDKWVDDYTCAQMTITEKEIADMKEYASRYKKPATPVLHYITANSIDCYKKQLPLKGESNQGVVLKDASLTVDHNLWKNAVAYETYEGDALIKIAFAGAGSNDNKTTLVRYPENATHVMAVGWNGERKMVFRN